MEIPESYAIITEKNYQNAVGLCRQGNAFLQPVSENSNLKYEKGKTYIKGLPVSMTTLKDYFTNRIPDNINLSFLRFFYSIILDHCQNILQTENVLPEVYTIYLPDFFKSVGRISVKNEAIQKRDDYKAVRDRIMTFQTVIGVIDGDYLPILLFAGENREKNTISFMSPYMNRVIEKVYKASIRKDKKGRICIGRGGRPETKATHSYLIKSEIIKERNRKAVEIVHIVVTLIEQAGNGEPHICAKTIVERNVLLRESITTAHGPDKNRMLKRAFSKAWELLRTHTKLQAVYPGIELPDPSDVPTMSTLAQKVYNFRHSGKLKNRGDEKPA